MNTFPDAYRIEPIYHIRLNLSTSTLLCLFLLCILGLQIEVKECLSLFTLC